MACAKCALDSRLPLTFGAYRALRALMCPCPGEHREHLFLPRYLLEESGGNCLNLMIPFLEIWKSRIVGSLDKE